MASRTLFSLLFGSFLVFTAQGSRLAAQADEGPRLVSEVQLSPTEKMGTVEGLPSHRVRGPLYAQAPPPPPGEGPEELEEEQPGAPVIEDAFTIPSEQTATTESATPVEGEAPGTFTILRNSAVTPNNGFISSVNEPSVGSQGDGIFTTFNWYAAISTNNGSSVSYVSPFTTFPNSPSAFSAGFCCDQRAAQDSSRNLVFWFLQYIKTGSTSTSTNGVRLALAHGQAGLAANSWTYYDFTPANFSLPAGTWLDFPHMQVSANYLYFTSNIFNTAGDSYFGALIARLPLSQLDSGSPLTFNFFTVVGSYGSIMPVNGASAEGTRPGRTTMYFAAVNSTTSIKVLTWPESSTTITISTVSGLASSGSSGFTCPGPGGLDPCTRASLRMQTGWITDSELGLMWNSSQNGASRPYPYIRAAILNPTTLAVLSQPDIYNTTNAWLYPAISVNERGHLGGTADFLGGNQLPSIGALIRDDFSPDLTTTGWEAYSIAIGTAGTSGRYGDYNGAMPHEKYPKTWLAVGHRQVGGSADSNSVTHNYWFSRERDNPVPTTCTSFSISPTSASPSASSGSQSVAVTGSPAGCQGGSWSASGNGSWLTVSPTSGTGSGSVTVFWAQNTSPTSRSSSATIAGNSFSVNQAGSTPPTCTSFSISPASANPSAASGSQSVAITGSPAGCSGGSWSASGNGSWLSVSPTSGTGSGSVTVFWTQNTSPSSRSSSATIAGNSFSVNQAGGAGAPLPRAPADFDGDGVSDWVVYRSGTWLYFGPCAHPLNETGSALNPACSRCVNTVCISDSFCCASSWDSTCIGEAVSLCP